jgi:hypothetical protein
MNAAFLELVVKLNETTFKPLFRRLFDWAFTLDSGMVPSPSYYSAKVLIVSFPGDGRRIVFCQVYMALLDFFKVGTIHSEKNALLTIFPGIDDPLHGLLIDTFNRAAQLLQAVLSE